MKAAKNASTVKGEAAAATVNTEAGSAARTPRVYCGPSVRGVARQYTVFTGKLPETLEEFLKDHPAARGLIVGTAGFAQIRKALETPGTRENLLYKKIKSEIT